MTVRPSAQEGSHGATKKAHVNRRRPRSVGWARQTPSLTRKLDLHMGEVTAVYSLVVLPKSYMCFAGCANGDISRLDLATMQHSRYGSAPGPRVNHDRRRG